LIGPAFLGGVFIGVLSALPIISLANVCCCLWIISGGVLAVYLQQQNQPQRVTPGQGALSGLLAGVIGAVIWVGAAMAVDVLMGPIQERMLAAVLETSSDMPPDVRAWLEEMASRSTGATRYVAGFMFHLFAGMMFATLGGLLGVLFFRKDVPPALGGTYVPPPPPPSYPSAPPPPPPEL
jgi:hypothetical protein